MKVFITILFALAISISGFSQYQIDWRNAPLNPIPVKYTLNHFKLQGPVKKAVIDDLLGKQILFFNTFGKLDSSITDDFLGHEKKYFEYDSTGTLAHIISSKKYGNPIRSHVSYNSFGHITQLNKIKYEYNQAGFLILAKIDESTIQYGYNKTNQLTKKEVFDIDDNLELTIFYRYIQYADHLRIEENRKQSTNKNDNIWAYDYDSLGHLYFDTNMYDSIGNYLGSTPNKTEAVIEYY